MGTPSVRPGEAPTSTFSETRSHGTLRVEPPDDEHEICGPRQVEEAPRPETLSEEAETEDFARTLRARRNDRVFLEGAIGLAVAAAIALGVVCDDRDRVDGAAAQATAEAAVEVAPLPEVGPPAPPVQVEGPVGRAAAERAVAEDQPSLQRCFALGTALDATGTITMKVLVGESGAVIGIAQVGSTIANRDVVHCVARSMRTLSLPPAPARSLVTYPLQAATR